jgi:hypothetical protein
MTARIPHQLTRTEAKQRIQDQLGTVREQYGSMLSDVKDAWTGDTMEFSLTAMGQSVSGRLTVEDHVVHVSVALPWILQMVAGAVKPAIEEHGRKLLTRRE